MPFIAKHWFTHIPTRDWLSILISIQTINLVLKSWPAFLPQPDQSVVLPARVLMLVLLRVVPRQCRRTLPNKCLLQQSTQRPSRRPLVHRPQPTPQSGKTVLSFCQHSEVSPETVDITLLATTSTSALETIAVHVERAPRVLSPRINQPQREAESFNIGWWIRGR